MGPRWPLKMAVNRLTHLHHPRCQSIALIGGELLGPYLSGMILKDTTRSTQAPSKPTDHLNMILNPSPAT